MKKMLVMLPMVLLLLLAATSAAAYQMGPPPEGEEVVSEPATEDSTAFTETELIDIPMGYACPPDYTGFLAPGLVIGMEGATVASFSPAVDLRALPDVRGLVLGSAEAGSSIDRVIGGPACSGFSVWWLVESNGMIGWAAESDAVQFAYWLEAGSEPVLLPEESDAALMPIEPPLEPSDETLAPVEPAVEPFGEEIAPVEPASEELAPIEPAVEPASEEFAPIEPAVEPSVVDADIRIDYNWGGLTLINLSDAPIQLWSLSFSSDTGEFAATDWNVNVLDASDCVQLYYIGTPKPEKPADCDNTQSWIQRGFDTVLFWRSEFTVSMGDEIIGVCTGSVEDDSTLMTCGLAVE